MAEVLSDVQSTVTSNSSSQKIFYLESQSNSPVRPNWNGNEVDSLIYPPMDHDNSRYPFCVVWTPLPLLTWLFPLIGHMGIAMSNGIIRDFAGPYFVSEDHMAFGKPTKYWQLNIRKVRGGQNGYDRAVSEASEEYMKRMHILCYDNCHSHVAMALNLMHYNDRTNWNMVRVAFYMLWYGKYVGFWPWLKTWLPFMSLILCLAQDLATFFDYLIYSLAYLSNVKECSYLRDRWKRIEDVPKVDFSMRLLKVSQTTIKREKCIYVQFPLNVLSDPNITKTDWHLRRVKRNFSLATKNNLELFKRFI